MTTKVFVGIPSGSDWKADFGMSLVQLAVCSARPLKDGSRLGMLQIMNAKGSILSRSRQSLAQQAIEAGATHLLFIDSDMTFPNYTLHQLLAANKLIVAANCVTKVIPAHPTARQAGEKPAGMLVDSRGKTGLEKVWRVGTGVMLIDLRVFTKIEKPWFPITWNEANDDYTGEDWNFCDICQKAGIDIYVDHDLSKHIGHVGALEFNVTHQGD